MLVFAAHGSRRIALVGEKFSENDFEIEVSEVSAMAAEEEESMQPQETNNNALKTCQQKKIVKLFTHKKIIIQNSQILLYTLEDLKWNISFITIKVESFHTRVNFV